MKTLKLILLFSFLGLNQFSVEARHLIGGNMTYEALGNGDYRFNLTVFRDAACENCATIDSSVPIAIYKCNPKDNCQDLVQGDQLFYFNVQLDEIEVLDSANYYYCRDSLCRVGDLFALEKGTYDFKLSDFDISLPNISKSYFVAYQRCCLPVTINNLDHPADQGFSSFVEITPKAQSALNSMPTTDTYQGAFVTCTNEPTTINLKMDDRNGDDIRYRMCSPLTGGGRGGFGFPDNCDAPLPDPPCPPPYGEISFRTPFNSGNPFETESGFSLDFISGTLSFTPSFTGLFLTGVCVDEYRNGELLSTQNLGFNVVSIAGCEKAPVTDKKIAQRIKIHPNPAQNYIQVDLPDNFKPEFFTVNSISGKSLLSGDFENSNTLMLPNLPEGFYILRLHSTQIVVSKKILISSSK